MCVYVAFWPVDATKVVLMSNNLALNDATVRTINPITNTHTQTHAAGHRLSNVPVGFLFLSRVYKYAGIWTVVTRRTRSTILIFFNVSPPPQFRSIRRHWNWLVSLLCWTAPFSMFFLSNGANIGQSIKRDGVNGLDSNGMGDRLFIILNPNKEIGVIGRLVLFFYQERQCR